MPLNNNLPEIEGWIVPGFVSEKWERCIIMGVSSVESQALGFHCLLDSGALFWRLPIHALRWRVLEGDKYAEEHCDLKDLELWDCFSYDAEVYEMGYLHRARCEVLLPPANAVLGRYWCTVDWKGNSVSERGGASGHKCAHLILLDDGRIAAQPNNRIYWRDPAWCTAPLGKYKLQHGRWKSEGGWATGDSEDYFYEVKPFRPPENNS